MNRRTLIGTIAAGLVAGCTTTRQSATTGSEPADSTAFEQTRTNTPTPAPEARDPLHVQVGETVLINKKAYVTVNAIVQATRFTLSDGTTHAAPAGSTFVFVNLESQGRAGLPAAPVYSWFELVGGPVRQRPLFVDPATVPAQTIAEPFVGQFYLHELYIESTITSEYDGWLVFQVPDERPPEVDVVVSQGPGTRALAVWNGRVRSV